MRSASTVGLLVAAALVLAPAAGAADVRSEKLTHALQAGTGKPVDASCESDDDAWVAEIRDRRLPGTTQAYSAPAGSRSRFAFWICQEIDRGAALAVVGIEIARLRGVSDDGLAGCYGLLWAADLGRRVIGIPFFTDASRRLMQDAQGYYSLLPSSYRTACG